MAYTAVATEGKQKTFTPTMKQEERRLRIYSAYKDMRDVMTQKYREFNDRTLSQFIDDSQKRANGYVTSREDQGKEAWQANVFTQLTRNKVKAHIATITKDVPKVSMTAVNESNQVSFMRAEVMELLVKASYVEKGNNPERVMFLDSWNCSINGTVIKYDGYLKKVKKQQEILAFNTITGEIELADAEEVVVEDRAIELDVPLQNFFIRNPYIVDLQQQPDCIWFSSYDSKDSFLDEWGKFPNADTVQEVGALRQDDIQLFFGEKFVDTTGNKSKIEVLRYYNKVRDEYCVYANGVELLATPLLWGKRKKYYPFAKTVFEPFANSTFFWGNSLPNVLMADQDVANSFINLMIDKTHRSLHSPMLIDVQNRDAFQLEDEYVTGDTKIYVNRIEGVKPMPRDGVTQAEFAMLEKVSRGIDLSSVDSLQQGVSGSGSTAREIVIANERADEIKGLFFLLMKDLWLQKYVLRVQNVLLHYSDMKKVEMIVGGEKMKVFRNQFNLPQATLSDGTTGMMQVNVFENREMMPNESEIGVQEEMARMQGRRMEMVNIVSDYLDDWEYTIQLETETFRQKNRALDMAFAAEKTQWSKTYFPEIFQANKNEFFRDGMRRFDDDPEKYLQNLGKQPEAGMMGLPAETGQPAQKKNPLAVLQQLSAPAQSLPQLSGVQV